VKPVMPRVEDQLAKEVPLLPTGWPLSFRPAGWEGVPVAVKPMMPVLLFGRD
jgi:hypothetical protein